MGLAFVVNMYYNYHMGNKTKVSGREVLTAIAAEIKEATGAEVSVYDLILLLAFLAKNKDKLFKKGVR